MFDAVWLNVSSIILVLTAWALPFINLMHPYKADHRNWIVFSVVSASACAVSLYMQICYTVYLVRIEGWFARMNTTQELALVATIFFLGTASLNTLTFLAYSEIKS